MRLRTLLVLGLAMAVPALAATGCAPNGPSVVKVGGTVTCAGNPVNKLVVNFVPDNGRPSWGETDEEGHYTLHYERGRDGAVIGTHTVWVQLRPANPREEIDMQKGLVKLHHEMKTILRKYGKEKTSPLKVQVKEDNQVIDLLLD